MREREFVTQDSNGRLLDSASARDNHPDPWILHVIPLEGISPPLGSCHQADFLVPDGWGDERHWFAAAVPGDGVRDVRTAIANLRPTEIEGRAAIRQSEWFFVPEPDVDDKNAVILRNEPHSRGGGSKPHVCAQMTRKGGEVVMVCSRYSTGIGIGEYQKLISRNPNARQLGWRRMVRDADVYACDEIRHRDHKTIDLRWLHRVFMNRERFAKHAPQIAFLD
jgi:hypothetical protein